MEVKVEDNPDWQNNCSKFKSRFTFLLSTSLHTDCRFIVEGEEIKCHKLVLASASPVFETMFYGSIPERITVELTDVKQDAFMKLMRAVYGTPVKDSLSNVDEACNVYNAAKKYMIGFVERDCSDYLSRQVSSKNAIQIYEFAAFHGVESLERQCLMKILLETENVLTGEDSIANASQSTILWVLDMSALNVKSEVQLFRAVGMWVEQQSHIEPEELKTLIGKIRFLALTVDEFISDVMPSNWLTDKEKLDVLLRLAKPDSLPAMINGLSEERGNRQRFNNLTIADLTVEDIKNRKCDENEWIMSVFTCSRAINLLGVEVRLQKNGKEGEYLQNMMVQLGLAEDRPGILAEGRLNKTVLHDSKKIIFFKTAHTLEPGTEYSIHLYLLQPGTYPFGYHKSLGCCYDDGDLNHVEISFISHTSNSFLNNSTNLSGLVFTSDEYKDE